MKTRTIIIRLVLGFISIPIVIFLTAYLLFNVIGVEYYNYDRFPLFFCFTAYLTAGLITKNIPIKFTPILLIPLGCFILMDNSDLLILLLLFAIGTLLITRKNFKPKYKLFVIFPMLLWFLFCLFSEPLIIEKHKMMIINGEKVRVGIGKTVIWDFNSDKPKKLPDLDLLDADNNKVSLSQFNGKKIFISFWATWCGPCIEEKPKMEIIKTALKEYSDIIFIDISLDEDFGRWNSYLISEKPQGIQLILNEDSDDVFNKFRCRGIPFGVIVNTSGNFSANERFRPEIVDIVELMKNLE